MALGFRYNDRVHVARDTTRRDYSETQEALGITGRVQGAWLNMQLYNRRRLFITALLAEEYAYEFGSSLRAGHHEKMCLARRDMHLGGGAVEDIHSIFCSIATARTVMISAFRPQPTPQMPKLGFSTSRNR